MKSDFRRARRHVPRYLRPHVVIAAAIAIVRPSRRPAK